MRLHYTLPLPVPVAQAWAALDDLALLQRAIPGCEALARTGPDTCDATMAPPAGLLAPRFTAHLRRADVTPRRACTISFDAATLAGSGAGEARFALAADGRRATTLTAAIELRIAGPAAQLGEIVLDAAARHLADEFFARFAAALRERGAERAA